MANAYIYMRNELLLFLAEHSTTLAVSISAHIVHFLYGPGSRIDLQRAGGGAVVERELGRSREANGHANGNGRKAAARCGRAAVTTIALTQEEATKEATEQVAGF